MSDGDMVMVRELAEMARRIAQLEQVEAAARVVSRSINERLDAWEKGDCFDVVALIEDDRALRRALDAGDAP